MAYSVLGEFTAPRAPKFVPYAHRAAYAGTGRHHVKPSRSPRALLRWFQSAVRDLGDNLLGAFAVA